MQELDWLCDTDRRTPHRPTPPPELIMIPLL
jgi:hypothetical protein